MGEWMVSGRYFRTKTEYEAAEKDARYIEQIKSRYNLEKKEETERLLRDLQEGKYRFRTILGADFEESLQEKIQKSDFTPAGKKNPGKKTVQKSKKSSFGPKGNTKKKGKKTAAAKKQVRLEDYDAGMQKIIRQELKKQERRRKIMLVSCVCVAAVCFGYLGQYYYEAYQSQAMYDSLADMKNTEQETDEEGSTGITQSITINYVEKTETPTPEVLEEYKSLYNKNKSLIGWIKIADTNIDYPVMQAADNEYYLRRNFEQEYDKNGCIFLDKDCNVIERSTNLIAYGHHMRSGKMFGKLDKYYGSKTSYEKYRYIEFDTIYEKGTYEVMYVFRSRIYEEDEIVFKYYQFIDVGSEAEFNSNMSEMAEMSLYDTGVTAEYGDELLTLSTCDYYTDYGRFVVVAKRIK